MKNFSFDTVIRSLDINGNIACCLNANDFIVLKGKVTEILKPVVKQYSSNGAKFITYVQNNSDPMASWQLEIINILFNTNRMIKVFGIKTVLVFPFNIKMV